MPPSRPGDADQGSAGQDGVDGNRAESCMRQVWLGASAGGQPPSYRVPDDGEALSDPVRHRHRIGDAILSSGLIKRLHDDSRRSVHDRRRPSATPLYRRFPDLEQIILMAKGRAGHWFKIMDPGARPAMGFDAGSPRFGPEPPSVQPQAGRLSRRPGAEPVHKVIEAARLLRLADAPPPPFLFTSEETEAKAERLLGEGGPILAIGPAPIGSARPGRWSASPWPPCS